MSKPKFVSAIAVALILFTYVPARADMASLQDLIDGASLTDGSTTYSGFQLLSDIGTVSPDLSMVNVMTLFNGLEFQGNGQFQLGMGSDSLIFQIGYDSMKTGPAFYNGGVDLSAGNPLASGEGLIDLFSAVSDSGLSPIGTANAIVDPLFGLNELSDSTSYSNPDNQINTVASLTLFADSASSVSLDSFQVTSSIPEPASGTVLAIAGVAIMFRRKRQA